MCCQGKTIKGVIGLTKAAAAVAGINPVPQTMLEQRVRACLGHGAAQPRCERATVGGIGIYCNHPDCGCWIKAKIRVKSERCPLGKWERVEEKDEGRRMKDKRNADEGVGAAG